MYISYKGQIERLWIDEGKELSESLDCTAISCDDLKHEIGKFAKKHSLDDNQKEQIEVIYEEDNLYLRYATKKSDEELKEVTTREIENVKKTIDTRLKKDAEYLEERLQQIREQEQQSETIITSNKPTQHYKLSGINITYT